MNTISAHGRIAVDSTAGRCDVLSSRRRPDELLHDAAELSDVHISGIADGHAMTSSHPGAWQFSQDFSVQVPQDPAGPDPLVFRNRESGDSAGAGPLAQK